MGRVGNQLTEEEEESDAVEDQNVGYVGDACVVQQDHLFLGGAHEEEAGGIEQLRKRKQVSIMLDIPHRPERRHTNGVRYWKLFGSERAGLSFSTNEISMMRVRPAAIRVYPKRVWTIVLIIRCWG